VGIVVVGAGIVGLAVAQELVARRPGIAVTVIEKEATVAAHQTGHNSGVIHAGIYYQPGTLKAALCRRGGQLLRQFADEHAIRYERVGKLIVAADESQLPGLDELERRARGNGVSDVVRLDAAGMAAVEPYVGGVAALHSPSTCVIDYSELARAVSGGLARSAEIRLSTELLGLRVRAGRVVVETSAGDLRADRVIVCAGLQSSEIAEAAGASPDPRIIPFRGEYYRLRPERAGSVRGMVYPVPDPRYPFLGIHITRRVNGEVEIGPNAVLALALEGYRRRDIRLRDVGRIVAWPGARALARQHWRTGAHEVLGSLSKRYFLAQARKYLPALRAADLVPAHAGVRAQAVALTGQLVDDFSIDHVGPVTYVRNAPSPAATSSLAIAEHIVRSVLDN
jgi:L-2-hydroxyglutarate oxidase LhgO